MTIGRRSRSRSRNDGDNWTLLVTIGIVAVLLISGLVITPSVAFTTASVDRGTTAPIADNSEGFLGINVTDSLQAGSEGRLVTVTNNLNRTLSVDVSSSATLSNSQATLGPGESLTTAATVGCESPPNNLDLTITASTNGEFSGIATRSTSVNTSDCADSTLDFGSVEITDDSTSGQGGKAEYTVTYSVEGDTASFGRVSVGFKNVDRSDTVTDNSDAQSDTIVFESGGQRFGDSYEITVRLIDDTGEVQSERIINDAADGG
jgi:hypothetical protein